MINNEYSNCWYWICRFGLRSLLRWYGSHRYMCDVDKNKIERLLKGDVPIYEPGLEELSWRMSVRVDLNSQHLWQILLMNNKSYSAVGTPPYEDGSRPKICICKLPDNWFKLKKYIVVVTKSTVPVGTACKVRETIQQELDKRGADVELMLPVTWISQRG